MVGTVSFISIIIMIAGGIILPVGACLCWLLAKKEKITTVLIGAATWFLFAMILETIPKMIFFNPALPLGKAVMGNAVLYTVIGALTAGIFEETGRFVAFKTVLRKRTNRETAISHGLGHGGFEALYILLVTGIQFLVFALMINSGTFQTLIDQTAATGTDVSGIEALPAQIMALTPVTSLISLFERTVAMVLHVGLSILVFYSVRESKVWMFILAILAHSLFDVPAALYQTGVIGLYVTEGILAVFSVAFFVIVYFVLYKKDRAGLTPENSQTEDPAEGASRGGPDTDEAAGMLNGSAEEAYDLPEKLAGEAYDLPEKPAGEADGHAEKPAEGPAEQ